jgi:hypothetical protein
MDIDKLAEAGVAGLGKLSELATKAIEFVTKSRDAVDATTPKVIEALAMVKAVLEEAGPVFQQVMPFFKLLAGFFPSKPAPVPVKR